jgi:hypothetical protein
VNVVFHPKMTLQQMMRFCAAYERILRFEWRAGAFVAYADTE